MNASSIIFAAIGLIIGSPIGVAFTPLVSSNATEDSLSLRDTLSEARDRTATNLIGKLKRTLLNMRNSSPHRQDKQAQILKLITLTLLVVWLVYIYAIHAFAIATSLAIVSIAVSVTTAGTFIILYWRRVVDGSRQAVSLVLLLAFTLAGLTSAIWTIDPPVNAILDSFLNSTDSQNITLSAAIKAFFSAAEGSFPILAFQMVGVALSYLSVIYGFCLCIACTSSVYIYLEVRGYRFTWIPLFWICRWTTNKGIMIFMCFAVSIALLLVGGFAYAAVDWLANTLPEIIN